MSLQVFMSIYHTFLFLTVPSMFENEGIDEAMEAEDAEEPSVAVSSESALGVCPTCHDTFSQFFHQETEEWRYHNAIQVDGVNYHPACHQDMLRVSRNLNQKWRIFENNDIVSFKTSMLFDLCLSDEPSLNTSYSPYPHTLAY